MTSRRRVVSGIALLLLLSVGAAIRASATWTFAGNLTVVRTGGGLPFLLPDGTLLLVGGLSTGTATDLTTDVFNPATGTWSPGPPSLFAHPDLPAGVRLADGRILVTGGRYGYDVRTSAEIFDPSTNTWTATGSMLRGRAGHTLTSLADGRILAAGGWSGYFDSSAEIYNPATGTWTWTNSMAHGKWFHSANLMSDGRVLVVGGEHYYDGLGPHFKLTEYYDPSTGAWTAGPQLTVGRADHQAAVLPDGRLMVVGGLNGFGTNAALASTEIFDGFSWQSGPPMAQPRFSFPLVLMSDGALLVTGGTVANTSPQAVTAATERYDAATNAWTSSGVMNSPRRLHVAAQLADGRVIVAGGQDGSVNLLSSEIMSGDSIAPNTTATPSTPPNANGWNNSDVTVTLQASDGTGGSGVQSIAYFLPGSSNVVSGDSVEVIITAEGITTLTYQATDSAGNVETQRALTIRIDKTAPLLPGLPNLSAAATSSAGAVVNFWILPFDNGSGIASTQIVPLSSGMTFPLGTTRETVTVFDAAGNSTVGGFDVTVNPTRPFISVVGGTFTADGNPHPATAAAVDQANNPVAGTFNVSYLPGGSVPVAPGRYSATASFTSTDPAFTSAFPWTMMAPDPNAKRVPAVVEINGKLYVHGFDHDAVGNPTIPRLSIYDPWSNTWTIGASPGLLRAYVSAGVIGGKLYVAGGCVMADCRIGTTNALEIYDPVSNTWSNGAAMPTARFGAASGAIGTKLYVAGGTTACAPCAPTSNTEIYDPATNTWIAGAPIPVSRELAAGAATNGRLYVIGGFERNAGNPLNGAVVGTVHAYDPVANTWSVHSSMPTARHGAAVGVVFGRIFVAGGYAQGPIATNERYDPGTDGWTPQVPMSTARYYVSGAVVGSTFHVIDGTNGPPLNTNEAFDSSLTTTITINPTDTTPPTTNASFPQPNANGWNRFNVNVFLNAFDSGGMAPPSGVQAITYSLTGAQTGGGTFNTSSTSFNIVNEGITTVTYHATDNLGNVEADQTFTVKLDKTAPSAANLANITVNATAAAGAVVTFDLAPSDSLSGIDTVTFNQGLPSGATFPHGNTSENIVITDKAGNTTFRSFNITVNKTLTSIAVLPATKTISLGQGGQQFQAMGHFTDGSDQVLPSQSGGSGGGSGSGGSVWQLNFSPSLDISACGNAPGGLSSQAITPIAGVVNNNWGAGNIVQVTGTVTLQQVSLALACNPASGSTGSLSATWTGTRYEGTVTSFNGSTSSVVITGWSAKASMPTARFSFGAAAVNGIVYAMGGGNPSQPQPVDAYDPVTNSWSTVSTMLTSREGAGVATLGGKIYVAGGNVAGGIASGVFEAYDPAVNSWSTLTSMPTARAHLALVVAGGKLYAIGGDTGAGGSPATAVVERYDPSTNQWTARASMSAARTFFVAGALNNDSTIVATGSASGTTELYDVAANSWTAGPAMLSSGGLPAAAVANNALFVFGIGSSGSGVQMFRPTGPVLPSGWAVLGSMPTGRGQPAAAVIGDVIYALGGMASGGASLATTEVLSAPPPSNFSVSSGGGGGGGGGSSLPTVSWQSTNTAVAAINSFGFATGNSLGQTTIIASAVGISCQPTACATLTVADTTPPNLFVPSQPFFATAASAAGTTVNFANAVSAFDAVDGNITPSCTPSSGSLFPIGPTTVSCQAIDALLNASPIKTFTVQVNDGLTVNVPANIVAEATSASGAGVPFSVTATYFLGGSEPVECFIITGFIGGDPQIGPPVSSGATFPLGTTIVGCQATSATGQHTGNFFTITVQDTTAPVVTTSGNVTINATSVSGAVATFTALAVDLVDGVTPVTCAPASGSGFAIGVTTVTCSAIDVRQNTGSASFTVTVLSPAQMITNLIAQASTAQFKQGGNLLQNALQNFVAGNVSMACSQLGAFINQVQAQSGKSISAAAAASLIQLAMEAKAAMGC